MGEMADFTNELGEEEEDLRLAYRTGSLSFDEAFELGIVDEFGSDSNQTVSYKTCRCCGEEMLHWGQYEGKWRLFNNEGLHKCKANPLNPNFNKEPSNAH